MKQKILLILGITTTLAYSAAPTQTGLLVENARHHVRRSSNAHLLQQTLTDNDALVTQRELHEKQLRQLKATAERNPQTDLTADITAKEQELAKLVGRRRETMGALELQMRRPRKKEPIATSSEKAPEAQVTVVKQEEEENLTNPFPTNLPLEYASDALMLYLYAALRQSNQ